MFAILRQYELALWAIVSRPWMLLILGLGVLLVGWGAFEWARYGADPAGAYGVMTAVPVVERSSGIGRNELHKSVLGERLASVTKIDTESEYKIFIDENGQACYWENGRRDGGWNVFEQTPALKKLWMRPPDMLSEEGWRRIGEHTALEVLSLPNVRSPDPATLERFPTFARAALEQLPRLRELDLRGTGGSFEVFSVRGRGWIPPCWTTAAGTGGSFELLLPPLPKIEVLAIGHGRLEENLRTLADGSPRLRVLAIQTWADMRFTPGMIESLRRMPNLRRVYVAGAYQDEDEPAMTRQVNELSRALPGVAVHPGTYRESRVWTAIWATLLGAYFPSVVWIQVSLLLSTSLAWMLPRRLAPHLFWAMAVAAACGGIMVAVLVSAGVAWMPALTLTLFTTMLLAGAGLEYVELIGILAAAATVYLAPWCVDRWLSGGMPRLAAMTLVAVIAAAVWKLARQARLPQILSSLGLASPTGLVIDTTQGTLPKQPAGSFANWLLSAAERAVDRQIDRPVPAPYSEMLTRLQPRIRIMLMGAIGVVPGAAIDLVGSVVRARDFVDSAAALSQILPGVIANFIGFYCVMAISLTAAMWGQRRESLVIDFLRPVSRAGYWQGLRKAIALDLVFPAVLWVAYLGMTVGMSASGGPWAWGVAVILLIGTFAMADAMIFLLAVTRWPLVVGTLMVVLEIGVYTAHVRVLSVSKPVALSTALVVAGAIFAVGLLIRTGVLWRLEEREIG